MSRQRSTPSGTRRLPAPLWKPTNEGVNRPAQLKEVKNFDAQVAGDAQTNALLALCLSIVVIMVYIWFRFGNLKYGTATAVALLHDTVFTIAALGLPTIWRIFRCSGHAAYRLSRSASI